MILADVSKTFAASLTAANICNALAWFLFAFAVFNTYMLIVSTRVNAAAHDPSSPWILHAGGWMGILTAAVAWYTSAGGVWNGVSRPVMRPSAGRS